MTTQQPNLVNLARQGDGKAIAALINRSLQSKGIFARVALQDGFLKVMLEGETTPDKTVFVPYIQQGIIALDITNIHTLQVFGRVRGATKPDWSQIVSLQTETAIAQPEAPIESVETSSELNQEDAIVSHLNQAIGSEEIAFSADLNDNLLKITAKTDQLLEGDTFAKLIRESLLGLSLTGIESVQIYKQKTRGNSRYKIKEFTLIQEAPSIAESEKAEAFEPQKSTVNPAAQMRSSSVQVDPRLPKRANKIGQLIPLAIVMIVFLFVSITRLVSVAPSAAEQCKTSLIEKDRCVLAVQIVGEQTIADAKSKTIASTEEAQQQSIGVCSKLALLEAEGESTEGLQTQSRRRSHLEATSQKAEEVFRGISLVDVQVLNVKTPETPVLRKACVLKQSQYGVRLLSSATIPIEWPKQAYEGTSGVEKLNRSLKVHQVFIVLGGNIVFTTIGLFVANLLNLGIRIFSIQTLLRTALVLGTMETTLFLLPGMNLVGAIPFSTVALLLTRMIVKDLRIEWESGYRVVAAGVGVMIIARMFLNWILLGLIFSII